LNFPFEQIVPRLMKKFAVSVFFFSHLKQSVVCQWGVNVIKGLTRVLENLESPGILLWHFPGLESPGKWLMVLESPENMLNSSKKY